MYIQHILPHVIWYIGTRKPTNGDSSNHRLVNTEEDIKGIFDSTWPFPININTFIQFTHFCEVILFNYLRTALIYHSNLPKQPTFNHNEGRLCSHSLSFRRLHSLHGWVLPHYICWLFQHRSGAAPPNGSGSCDDACCKYPIFFCQNFHCTLHWQSARHIPRHGWLLFHARYMLELSIWGKVKRVIDLDR